MSILIIRTVLFRYEYFCKYLYLCFITTSYLFQPLELVENGRRHIFDSETEVRVKIFPE